MFVGILRLTLYLPSPGSLKSKRHLLRSALDRVKARFNVSIAEVDDNDLWQRSTVGVAAVGNDHAFVNETLDKVAAFMASMHGGQMLIADRQMEILPYGDGPDGGPVRTLADAEREARAEGQPDEAAPLDASASPPPAERAGGTGARERATRWRRGSESPPEED
jgi:uncharacterized protein YlxP (DUF503 family)